MEEQTKTILLVEDDELLAITETRWLKKAGYKIIHANTGEHSIEIVNDNKDKIDLILMDINLGGGIDGTQAAQEILKENNIPLLFLSSHTEKEVVEKTEKITSYGYVVKDSHEVVLLASIKMAFRLYEANKELVEQKKALRMSEEKFSKAFYTSPDSISINRLSDGVYLEINDGFTQITGYTKEDVIGHSSLPGDLGIWVTSTDRKILIHTLEQNGELKNLEAQFRAKDGRKIIGLMSAKIIEVDGGECILTITRDISERNYIEESLRKSEKKYRDLFEKSEDALLIITNGKLVDCNPAAIAMLLYKSKQELLDNHPSELSPELQLDGKRSFDKANDMMRIALEKGSNRFEWYHKKANGEIFPVEVLLTLISADDENISFHTVWRDITKRKEYEVKLKESEKRYKDFIEQMLDGVYKSSHEGKFLEINKAMVQMLGYNSKEELFAIDIKSQLYFQESDRESAALEERLEEMAVFRLKKKDGSEIWVEDHGRHVLDDNGNVLYHEGVMRDVTQRINDEAAIIKSEEMFRAVFENNSAAIAIINYDTTISMVNDAYCQMSGYNKDEVIGLSWTKQIPPDDLDRLREYNRIRLLNPKEAPEKYEFMFYKKDGELRHGLMSVAAIPTIKKIITSFIDITDRKMDEFRQQKFNEELKTINETKDKFFSIISHDLKNPFQSINSSVKLLLSESDSLTQEELHSFLDGILNTSEKAFMLLENLLLWSRHQVGKIEFDPTKIELVDAVLFCTALLNNSAALKNISITSKVEEGIFIYADRNMLETILRNLLTNAIKFTADKGQILIESKRINGQIEISVIDNGVGIDEKNISKLFKIDQTFSTQGTHCESGTGLGLIISKEFIEKNKGTLLVESEVGKGTKISFTLPLNSECI